MNRKTFRLFTLASFCLLLFSLYLNFIYKGDNRELLVPVKPGAEEKSTAKTTVSTVDHSGEKPNVHALKN